MIHPRQRPAGSPAGAIRIGAVLAALLAAGTPPLAHADNDLCRNVAFRFVNEHKSGQPIRVEQVKYRHTLNDKQQTEEVANIVCDTGTTCFTRGDDLRDAEGVELTNVRFVYRVQQIRYGVLDWSDRITSAPHDPPVGERRCRADKIYGPFTIKG
jgi:hypothetical protein